MAQTFTTLRAANTARQAEWDPSDKITLAFRGNEMGGECGEAQNVIKKLERERLGIRGSRATVQDLADELADVVICADLIAMAEGIDLDQAIARKFNLTSEKHELETRLTDDVRSEPDDPTEEMIQAGLKVDFDNEDERATVINLWHAMKAAAPPAAEGDRLGIADADAKWLGRWLGDQKEGGHCGEGNVERRERAVWNDRIERILSALEGKA